MSTNKFVVNKALSLSPGQLYRAWTEHFDQWFAKHGTLLNWCQVGIPFYFVTEMDGREHPHHGRFLRIEPESLLELTWVTGDPGTKGAETKLTVEFSEAEGGTDVTLSHSGFADTESMDGHKEAWPQVFDHLQKHLDSQVTK